MIVNTISISFYIDLLSRQYGNQDFARPKEVTKQKKKRHEPGEQEGGLATGRGAALVKAAEHLGVVHG